MTKAQLEHHREQMDAARRDFKNLWENHLRTAAMNLGIKTQREIVAAEHVAWEAFLAGLRTRIHDKG